MPPNVTGNFSAAGGVAHMDRIFQVELFSQRCEIVSVRVHIVAIPRLVGTAVPSSVGSDDSIAALAEKQHLSVPVVRGERPAMTEHNRLSRAPILVVNLRTIFRGNRWHRFSPYVAVFPCGLKRQVLLPFAAIRYSTCSTNLPGLELVDPAE